MDSSDGGFLFVRGHQYPATSDHREIVAAEQRQGRTPLILVETPGALVSVGVQDFNPMLAKVIKAHLSGKWVMVMEPDRALTGRNIGPELEQRLKDVLGVLPIGWGGQPAKAEQLGITPRELAWALAELDKRGLAHRPKQGVWVRVPGMQAEGGSDE